MNYSTRLRGMWAAATSVGLTVALCSGGAAGADWNAGGGKDWEALLAAAKKEGQVVVSVCPGGMAETISRMFAEDTGIKIDLITGTLPELNTKYQTELSSGRVVTDVRLSGPTPIPNVKAGLLQPVKDMLILPSVTDESVWLGGKISYVDNTRRYMPIAAQYAGGRPLINVDIVDAKAIKTWDDLLKPEYKGKIAAMDPADGGIGGTAAQSIAKQKGIDFVGRLYKGQNVTLVTDRRQLVEWAARGVYPIVIGADAAPEIETFRQAGIKSLKALSLADGPGNLNGGCSSVSVPTKAPHPNAAAVFVNWFMSARGQEAYVLGQHQPSNRKDVTREGVPDYLFPDSGVGYFDAYGESFVVDERAALDAAIAKAMGK